MELYEQLALLELKKKYVQSVMAAGGLESWEMREYTQLDMDYRIEIAAIKDEIDIMNGVLA